MKLKIASISPKLSVQFRDCKPQKLATAEPSGVNPSADCPDDAAIDYSCRLSLATASAATNLPLRALKALTRSASEVAFARQIAMYLAHTKFGISYGKVGTFFRRDRSTVAHACQLIEKRRDDIEFDEYISRMEYLIDTALPNSPDIQPLLSGRFVGGVS